MDYKFTRCPRPWYHGTDRSQCLSGCHGFLQHMLLNIGTIDTICIVCTLQGINISPFFWHIWRWFSFSPGGIRLVSWRVYIIFRQTLAKKKQKHPKTSPFQEEHFRRDYELHTQCPTQRKPLSWTCRSTLTWNVGILGIHRHHLLSRWHIVSCVADVSSL